MLDEAIAEFRAALQLDPRSVEAHNNLGIALGSQGLEAAIDQFQQALVVQPDFVDAQHNLAIALKVKGQVVAGLQACPRSAGLKACTTKTVGVKARNRRGLSTRIFRSVASLTPAFASIGTNCVTVSAKPRPAVLLQHAPVESEDRSRRSA